MAFIDDPNEDARSLMMRAPCPCTGEVNGVACKNYWAVTQKFRAANASAVKLGSKERACHKVTGFMLEFKSEEKPTHCNDYEPRKLPGLVALVQRAAAMALGVAPRAGRLPNDDACVSWGYFPYDAEYEEFRPMTIEEIAKLRTEMPDRPVIFQHGKDPASMSVSDIMNGEPVGMLKPGEKVPGSELSPETEDALDGMFKNTEGGILK